MYPFDARFFTQIPNSVLNLIQSGSLKGRDLFTYVYLKNVVGPKAYTLRPIDEMAADMGASKSATKDSLSRLSKAGVVRRQRTIRNSKTFLLLRVKTRTERVREELERRGLVAARKDEKSATGTVDFRAAG